MFSPIRSSGRMVSAIGPMEVGRFRPTPELVKDLKYSSRKKQGTNLGQPELSCSTVHRSSGIGAGAAWDDEMTWNVRSVSNARSLGFGSLGMISRQNPPGACLLYLRSLVQRRFAPAQRRHKRLKLQI